MRRLTLQRRFEFLGFLDHRDNLLIPARTTDLADTDAKLTFFQHRSCIDIGICLLMYRQRFACHRCLIHHRIAIDNRSVKWDHISDMDHDLIIHMDRFCRYLHFLSVLLQPDSSDVQGHAPCKIPDGFLVCPLL